MPTTGDFPLQLSLPLGTDPVDIAVLNANFDVINEHAADVTTELNAIKANGWVTSDRVSSISGSKLSGGTVPSSVTVENIAGKRVYIQETEPTTTGWDTANTGTLWISW